MDSCDNLIPNPPFTVFPLCSVCCTWANSIRYFQNFIMSDLLQQEMFRFMLLNESLIARRFIHVNNNNKRGFCFFFSLFCFRLFSTQYLTSSLQLAMIFSFFCTSFSSIQERRWLHFYVNCKIGQ